MLRGADKTACEVVGVAKDAPNNSHIVFDMVLSGESWDYLTTNTQWTSNNIYTYFKTHPGVNANEVKDHLDTGCL